MIHCCAQDKTLALRVHEDIMNLESEVFAWSVRGPRLVRRIIDVQPDVLALQEYDCNDAIADYDGQGDCTFRGALTRNGYDSVFLKDKGKDDGTIIYFRRGVFSLATAEPSTESSVPFLLEAGGVAWHDGAIPVPEGEALEQHRGAVMVLDYEENWHPKPRGDAVVSLPHLTRCWLRLGYVQGKGTDATQRSSLLQSPQAASLQWEDAVCRHLASHDHFQGLGKGKCLPRRSEGARAGVHQAQCDISLTTQTHSATCPSVLHSMHAHMPTQAPNPTFAFHTA